MKPARGTIHARIMDFEPFPNPCVQTKKPIKMASLYIPKPCHENWGNMSESEKGKFCAVCTKEVVDFTRKTQEDIFEHLNQAEGKTCGRFLVSQLDPIAQIEHGRSKWEYRMKKALFSMLAFLGVIGLTKNAKAQKMGKVAIKGDVAYYEDHNTNAANTTINGQVTVNGGKTIQGAVVEVYSGETLIGTTVTMANGAYSITLKPGTIRLNKITVKASAKDFEDKFVTDFSVSKQTHRINFMMEEFIMMLGEVYIAPDTTAEEVIEVLPEEVEIIMGQVMVNSICTPVVNETPDTTTVQAIENVEVIEIPAVDIPAVQEEVPVNNNPVAEETALTIEVREEDLKGTLYPNPTRGIVNLVMQEQAKYYVEIHDLSGKQIESDNFTGTNFSIDTENYAPAIYLVRVKDAESGKKGIFRLVVQ